MALTDYTVIGVPPDLSEAEFVAILDAAHSPALGAASAVWHYCRRRNVSPSFLLAMFRHESRFGTVGTATQTHSWGNTRSPSFGGVQEMGAVPGRSGVFPVFANWIDGGISTAARWLDYAPYRNRTTVRRIIGIWAPVSDGNEPEIYSKAVLASIETWTKGAPPVAPTIIDKLLPAGLNHWDGHGPVEAVVMHVAEGGEAGVTSWFNNPASEASAHYLVCKDGRIIRYVRETDSAWANGKLNKPNLADPLIAAWKAGNINPNRRTISIETEGFWQEDMTPAQLASVCRLAADIHRRYGLPTDGSRLLGHNEFDSVDRARCPSLSQAEWSAIVAALKAAPAPAPAPQPAPFQHAPGWLDPIRDTFDWGGAGIVVGRSVRAYNDQEKAYYRRSWSAEGGFTDWEKE